MELIIALIILVIEVMRYQEWHSLYLRITTDDDDTPVVVPEPKLQGKKYKNRLSLIRRVNRGI